ncbi:MAG TPA: AsmA-like C-terminal region-containing protein [Terriglobales bacterium]|nr:AsmA-like C-terminal region-containing protein [Terriglobales bacterium]
MRKRLAIAGLLGVILAACVLGTAALHRRWVEPLVKQRLVAILQERFDGDVEIEELRISGLLFLRIDGEGLAMRSRERKDLPPLIRVKAFSVETGLLALLRTPPHVDRVRIEGLEITVPPRSQPGGSSLGKRLAGYRIAVQEIVSDNAQLTILPKREGKLPIVFDLHHVLLRSSGSGRPMSFRASLTNPKPAGEIEATGYFGPWEAEDPSLTPVSGEYSFRDADLNTIRGIGGILASTGKFEGILGRLAVQGETDTPDFSVDVGGNPVPLHTRFSAVVDGTSGDTLLDSVEARLGNSTILANGLVARTAEPRGRVVALDVSVPEGRIEDLLRLAVKDSTPPMTGPVRLQTQFLLLPGSERIAQRLNLSGRFHLASARFTKLSVRKKVETLSLRGQGKTEEEGSEVASDLEGRFQLKNGTLSISRLRFQVPGATVRLRGHYSLLEGTLDLRGTLALQAKLSQTTTGVKSFLLKAVDPWFSRKGAGTLLPIEVSGTAKNPQFGVDVGKALRRTD